MSTSQVDYLYSMPKEIAVLTLTAASIGFFHTLFGPDHYLPFIVLAKSGKWSLPKTGWVTFLCGLAHILSSVVLGLIGVAFGITLSKLEFFESFRGNFAAWGLVIFGLIYFLWGLYKAFKNQPHKHLHPNVSITPWILFTIFVFGPCEPLIPILMYPAAKNSLWGLILVTTVFGTITISTMLFIVFISILGINLLPLEKLERYNHALAGAAICICGLAIQFFGL